MSVVDLAGSERQRNTLAAGDRKREAGNINSSIMYLGTCIEAIRRNQRRPPGTKPEKVHFNHSKLTELFQGHLRANGKAVMLVHANPWDTGYDENIHIMRKAAVASDIVRLPAAPPAPPAHLRPTTTSAFVQSALGSIVGSVRSRLGLTPSRTASSVSSMARGPSTSQLDVASHPVSVIEEEEVAESLATPPDQIAEASSKQNTEPEEDPESETPAQSEEVARPWVKASTLPIVESDNENQDSDSDDGGAAGLHGIIDELLQDLDDMKDRVSTGKLYALRVSTPSVGGS